MLRECKDYFNAHYSNCEELETSDVNKVCITSSKGDFCEEQYKTCELYDTNEGSKNKANCEKIKTYSDTSKNFDNTKIDGCYFHFVKLLWTKAKKLGICQKEKIKITKALLFILKILTFTLPDNRGKIFDKIENYFNEENSSYKKLVDYYKKNWLENEYIDYTEIDDEDWL